MIILKSKLHSDHLLPTPDLLHLISSNKFAVCYDVSYLINKYIYKCEFVILVSLIVLHN